MTRDEIYDHLAQVYLGKRNKSEEKRKKEFNAWLVINIAITVMIFVSAFYGLTAFLAHRQEPLQSSVIFALNNSPIRIKYDFNGAYPPSKTFSLSVPRMDLFKYKRFNFSIRGLESNGPGVVKVSVRNQKKETASYFVEDVGSSWKQVSVPLHEFKEITDWSNITDVFFTFESWNVQNKKGAVLIEDVCFSS